MFDCPLRPDSVKKIDLCGSELQFVACSFKWRLRLEFGSEYQLLQELDSKNLA